MSNDETDPFHQGAPYVPGTGLPVRSPPLLCVCAKCGNRALLQMGPSMDLAPTGWLFVPINVPPRHVSLIHVRLCPDCAGHRRFIVFRDAVAAALAKNLVADPFVVLDEIRRALAELG